MLKVVISLEFSLRSNWWNPHFKSSLLNICELFISSNISSTVGIGCRSLLMASLARRMSIHSRISPFGFGTTTAGLTHSEGLLAGTGSITSKSISSCSFFSTFSLSPKGMFLRGCMTGGTFVSIDN